MEARSRLRVLLATATVFGVAFGVIEGAIVVYLRALFYPAGFTFPLRAMPPWVLRVELVREAATIVLLLAFAWVAARRPLRRFAVFAFCFAVWDLAYYATLKVVLDWPASLLEWDVLFLIPLPWIGPVLAPMLVSACLIAAAVAILRGEDPARARSLRPVDWAVEVAAGLLIVGTFLANTGAIARGEAPAGFPWGWFALGLGGGAAWFTWAWRRAR